jgi:hypothetical protein
MPSAQAKPSRRGFIWGAAAAGAAATAVATLPTGEPAPAQVATAGQPQPAPERGGGYHLSEHVQRYYKTTRL